ncbi:MAG: adventurous gliding motility protein CglE [Deltaproteobacteria bacterium]|nr:adventurous gliding motility protein CglE [Deltaproteobacteria bacterium]
MSDQLRFLRTLLLSLAVGALVVSPAYAQDDDDEDDDDIEIPEEEEDIPEEDEEEEEDVPTEEEERERRDRDGADDIDAPDDVEPERRQGTKKKKRRRKAREVVKGAYLKINVGPQFWLPPISAQTSTSATELDFSFGYDIIDRLPFTLTVEGSFTTLVANGTGVNDEAAFQQLLALGIAPTIQGDFRLYGGTVNLRFGPNFGGKKTKRGNFSIQVGGGGAYSPALIDLKDPIIINRMNANGFGYLMQGRFLGIITPGIGLEYYTKLSHFSLGLDVDANIIIGGPSIAIGVGTNFFAKYTF